MDKEKTEEFLDLLGRVFDMMEPLTNSLWLATEISPQHFHGFMGFETNPQTTSSGASNLASSGPTATARTNPLSQVNPPNTPPTRNQNLLSGRER